MAINFLSGFIIVVSYISMNSQNRTKLRLKYNYILNIDQDKQENSQDTSKSLFAYMYDITKINRRPQYTMHSLLQHRLMKKKVIENMEYSIEIRESYLRTSLNKHNDKLSYYYIHAFTGDKRQIHRHFLHSQLITYHADHQRFEFFFRKFQLVIAVNFVQNLIP